LRAKERIPTLAGVKYTDDDLVQMQRCLHLLDGQFEILNGYDEILLAALSLGVQGAVGSTYNFAAPLYREIIAQFHRGNLEAAQSLQHRSVELIQLLARFGFPAAAKFVMALVGVDCGPVRPPLSDLSAEDQAELRNRLDEAGYFDTWLR
jgi:N-acetylneuraminate lyase